MKKAIILFGLFLIFSSQIYGQVNGNQVYEWYKAHIRYEGKNFNKSDIQASMLYKGYVVASFGMLKYLGIFTRFETPELRQMLDIFGKHLENYPQKRHQPGSFLFFIAMGRAFPNDINYKLMEKILDELTKQSEDQDKKEWLYLGDTFLIVSAVLDT